jgi:hypothetical protein
LSAIFRPLSVCLPFLLLPLITISLFFFRIQPRPLPVPFLHLPPAPTALLTFLSFLCSGFLPPFLRYSVVTLPFPFLRPFSFFPLRSYGNFTPQHPDWLISFPTKHSPPAPPPPIQKLMHLFSALFLLCWTLEWNW